MKNNFSLAGPWLLIIAICLLIILTGLKNTLKKTTWSQSLNNKILYGTALSILLWIVLLSVLAVNGFFANFSKIPPRLPLAILLPLPFVLIISFSKKGKQLLPLIPAYWIVWMQSFRIAVELFLWMAFMANKLPVQMTFEGRNFDIVTGLLAIPVGYFLSKKIKQTSALTLAFNIIGLLLLINILVLSILFMPTPFRYFMNEPANTLLAQFPFILLPGVLVPLAYTLHIFSLLQLSLDRSAPQVRPVKAV